MPSRVLYLLFFLSGFCGSFVFGQSVGGVTSGAASYCSGSNSGFISVSGYTGTILFWESSVNGGAWTNIGNTTPNQSYFNITQSTCYRAVVQNGSFPADTSSVSCVTIYTPSAGGTLSTGGTFCGAAGPGSITLAGNNGNVIGWIYSTNGGLTWNSIANTTTTLTYTNISVNTEYEALVQNSSFCTVDTSSASVFSIDAVSNAGTILLSGNDSVCFALNSGTLTANGTTGAIQSWLYSTNSGASWTSIANTSNTQTFSNLLQDTWYEVIVKSGVCPPDTSGSAGITVVPLPAVNAGADTSILPGQPVTLNGSGSGSPFWIPSTGLSNPFSFSPVATPTVTTSYILVVTGVLSCLNADTMMISVSQPVFNGTVSNYFTPNGDGVNDTWYIQNIKNFPGNDVSVYNIYGNVVYSQSNYQNDWKGTYKGSDLPDGTYYYILKFSNSGTVNKGSVDIIRKK
jgi:gliding motility-associated-like protein